MRLGGRARRRVRDRQRRRRPQRLDERVLVLRVDEHAGARRHELRRPADGSGDDAAGRGERLERRLAEGLDEARLAEDIGGREVAGDRVVRDIAGDRDAGTALELGP